MSSSVAKETVSESPTQQEPNMAFDGERSSLTRTELSSAAVPQELDRMLEDVDVDVDDDDDDDFDVDVDDYLNLDQEGPPVGIPPSPPLEEVELAFRRSFFYQCSHFDMATPPDPALYEGAQQYLQAARIALFDKLHYRHPLMFRTKMDGSLEDDAWSGAFEPLRRSANTASLEDTYRWVEETRFANERAADERTGDKRTGEQPQAEELSDSSEADDW